MTDPGLLKLGDLLAELARLYAALPAQLAPGQRGGQRVGGTRAPTLPLRVDVLDLGMPAAHGSVRDTLRPVYGTARVDVRVSYPARSAGPYTAETVSMTVRVPVTDAAGAPVLAPSGDQVGQVGAATVLDAWAREWAFQRGEWLPRPTVAQLVPWLHARLEWAWARYGPLVDLMAEVRQLVGPLRFIVHGAAPLPEKLPTPCHSCDRRDLTRLIDEERIECGSCGHRQTEREYADWVAEFVASHRDRRRGRK